MPAAIQSASGIFSLRRSQPPHETATRCLTTVDRYNQQQHKYESGRNRIAAGRLDDICRALDWSIADALQALDQSPRTTASERRRTLAGQWFAKLSDRKADAALNLLRALAEPGGDQ
jgi:hypothetical protein